MSKIMPFGSYTFFQKLNDEMKKGSKAEPFYSLEHISE